MTRRRKHTASTKSHCTAGAWFLKPDTGFSTRLELSALDSERSGDRRATHQRCLVWRVASQRRVSAPARAFSELRFQNAGIEARCLSMTGSSASRCVDQIWRPPVPDGRSTCKAVVKRASDVGVGGRIRGPDWRAISADCWSCGSSRAVCKVRSYDEQDEWHHEVATYAKRSGDMTCIRMDGLRKGVLATFVDEDRMRACMLKYGLGHGRESTARRGDDGCIGRGTIATTFVVHMCSACTEEYRYHYATYHTSDFKEQPTEASERASERISSEQ